MFYRRVVLPVHTLLRMGASPERLAWSIAAGVVIGVNPLFGTTTALCLVAALIFRLNIAASQLGNYAVYPLQLLLLIPFLRLGSKVFHTAPIPLTRSDLLNAARSHPIALVREIWRWEWHALVVWAGLSVVLIPLIAVAFMPLLRRMLTRMRQDEHPIAD